MARAVKGTGSIRKRDNRWEGYVPVNGERKYFTANTRGEAEAKRRMLLNQRDSGELKAGESPTLNAWIEHWLKINKTRLAPSTWHTYTGYFHNHIEPAIGHHRLDKLTLDHLETLYADMAAAGLSGSTRHQAHSIIRAALRDAVRRGHVSRNVAALVQPPSVGKPKTESLSLADLTLIEAAASGDRLEARWLIALGLGLRPGEATALEWRHIDFDQQTITIEQQLQQIPGEGLQLRAITKTSAGMRTIPLPEHIMEALQRTREQQYADMIDSEYQPFDLDGPRAFCFTQPNGRPYAPRLDTNRWYELLERAGLPRQRRYIARHTAASWLLAHGVDDATVAKILGHASSSFTRDRYVHALAERVQQVGSVLDRWHAERHQK